MKDKQYWIERIAELPSPFGNVLSSRLDNLCRQEDFEKHHDNFFGAIIFPKGLVASCTVASILMLDDPCFYRDRKREISKELGLGLSDLEFLDKYTKWLDVRGS